MRILLLGNGFDLQHKLPTTYLCFLQTAKYIATSQIITHNIATVFEKISDDCTQAKESLSEYKEFYRNYSFENEDMEKLVQLKKLVETNSWFKFFLKYYRENLGWIDFEKEIGFVLSEFSEYLGKNCLCNSTNRENTTAPNKILELFDFLFSDGKLGRRRIRDEFFPETYKGSQVYSVDKREIYKAVYEELNKFNTALKIYFNVFVEKPLLKMKDENVIKTNSLFKDFEHVITFNYTKTYEKLYGEPSIHHIHGNIDENIILGVNPDEKDELEDLDTSNIVFKKYFQRIYYRTDISFIEMINDAKKNRAALTPQQNELVVCGHSLDVTDEDIIRQVFDVSDRIYIICYELSDIGNYVSNLIKIYGKSELDTIRSKKQLRFINYDEWNNIQQ